jgi:hypothetical protein
MSKTLEDQIGAINANYLHIINTKYTLETKITQLIQVLVKHVRLLCKKDISNERM